jgi:[glutamine synthetase] adenylyltransferase / [glutamine synthetase]-adenylyl-L-tyrosine phosphorylase
MRRPIIGKRKKGGGEQASLAARMTGALPRTSRQDRGEVADWLSRIARTAAGKTLAALVAEHAALAKTLDGIAISAPYLWDLARADPARLLRLLTNDPQSELTALLAGMRDGAAGAEDAAALMSVLRRGKTEAALLIALTDIGGVWPVAAITAALTDVADTALAAAVRYLLGEAARQGKLSIRDGDDPAAASGYFVLAMGKMGGHELNFSSDIDLIVLFHAEDGACPVNVEPMPFFVRTTRELVKLLQERTADGYVFRIDLRLRPDPASTQIAIATDAALDYYESRGQSWERAALIKARPCAGDLAAGERFLHELSPFIWRKYLDYAALADVHAMKQQIHAYRGHGEIAVEGHNIKLGRGGIREIEFFVQTQQLIAGGRHPDLRGRQTVAMLDALAKGGWVDADARDALTAAYDFLRRVEHRLQMIADEQTHTLPSDRETLAAFARFLGFKSRDAFAAILLAHLRAVERHYVKLFEGASSLLAQQQNLSFAPHDGEVPRETLDRLVELGFRQPRELAAAVQRWEQGTYGALRGEQVRALLGDLTAVIVDQFARSENPDAAFAAFDNFLAGLRAGSRLLPLLRRNPELIRFVALIVGVAPRLADILAQHPHVIDPLIDPTFFGALPDAPRLEAELAYALDAARGYEDMLDAIRLFGQEHMFLIGARILSGSLSSERAGEVFATLADVLVRALHARVEADFALVHGRIRGQQTAIVALGRLGAREMTASSDLDLIVIYDFDAENPNSDGKRALYGAQYFARLTQRLISALTARTNYGVLYEVDMRLRPSGRSGPLATHIDGFVDYQENRAWTWEHMALTRARVVSAPPAFKARIKAAIAEVLQRPRDAHTVAADVAEIRGAIAAEKGDADPWDFKYAAGGLIDIEFLAQYLQLVHAGAHPEILDTSTARTLEKAARAGVLKAEDADVLRPAAALFHNLTQILRLCLPGALDTKTANAGVLAQLARAADLPDFPALQAHVVETQRQVRACFKRILESA